MGEMAAVYAGGVAAGIYPTDTSAQVAYKAEHSAAVSDLKKTCFPLYRCKLCPVLVVKASISILEIQPFCFSGPLLLGHRH